MSDQVKITEEWIKFEGVVYLIWNGELMGAWPESTFDDRTTPEAAGSAAETARPAGDVTSSDIGSSGKHMRLVTEIIQSPLQRDQWVLTLECGHLYPFTGRFPPGPEVDCKLCSEEHKRAARELHDALKGFV